MDERVPRVTSSEASLPAGPRCAVHAVRPAVDTCPVCGRPRCADDAQKAPGGGCQVCRGDQSPAAIGPEGGAELENYVRAALASTAVALMGGVVAAQYVGAAVFAYLTPFVVGVITGAAAQAAAGLPKAGSGANGVRLIAALYAVLGVAFGFVLERSEGILATGSFLPYLAAVVGVILWTLPPKR